MEVIVIDDGSEDETAKILGMIAAEDQRLKFVSQDNAGRSKARNRGVALAHGEWLMFLDSDDYLFSDAEAAVCSALSSEEPLVLFPVVKSNRGGRLGYSEVVWDGKGPVGKDENISSDDLRHMVIGVQASTNKISALIRLHSAASTCSRIFKRDVIANLVNRMHGEGPYVEGIRFSEDKLMMLSYLTMVEPCSVVLSGQPLYFHDLGESQTSSFWHDGDVLRMKDFKAAVAHLIELGLIKSNEREPLLRGEMMNHFQRCIRLKSADLGLVCVEWAELMKDPELSFAFRPVQYNGIKNITHLGPTCLLMRHRLPKAAFRYYIFLAEFKSKIKSLLGRDSHV